MTLVQIENDVADIKAPYNKSKRAFVLKTRSASFRISPAIIRRLDPKRNWNPVKTKEFWPLPYFLIKTVHKALTVVDMRIKPSPASFIGVASEADPILVIIIPKVPKIRAMIIFLLILSPGKIKNEIITTIKELAAWIMDDLTPAVLDRPI